MKPIKVRICVGRLVLLSVETTEQGEWTDVEARGAIPMFLERVLLKPTHEATPVEELREAHRLEVMMRIIELGQNILDHYLKLRKERAKPGPFSPPSKEAN